MSLSGRQKRARDSACDPETEHMTQLGDHDPALNAWQKRTAACRDCTRSNGLRRLCATCRESLPQAPAGLKAQKRAGRLISKSWV